MVNFCKRTSLYSTGLRPLMHSAALASAATPVGWHRCGEDIAYFPNTRLRETAPATVAAPGRGARRQLFTLSFAVEFPADGDLVYLAHCFPYPYSALQAGFSSSTLAWIRLECLILQYHKNRLNY